jgi:hypothetical protein
LGALYCFLNGGGVFGAALLCVGGRTTDFIVVAQNLPHAFFELWLSQAVTRHRNQFFWPQFLYLAYLPGCHNNRTSYGKWIELQELILFQTKARKNLTIVE